MLLSLLHRHKTNFKIASYGLAKVVTSSSIIAWKGACKAFRVFLTSLGDHVSLEKAYNLRTICATNIKLGQLNSKLGESDV